MYQKSIDAGVAVKLVLKSKQGHEPKFDIGEVDRWFKKNLHLIK
jgi:hypothetical protein